MRGWFLWLGVLVVAGMGLVTAVPAMQHNLAQVRFNQLAASQAAYQTCPQDDTEHLVVLAEQFDGNGAIKQNPNPADSAHPTSYVKLYSDQTITTTQTVTPGSYYLQIYSKHARPGPVILQVRANQQPLGSLTYARDDDSWEGQCLLITEAHWQGTPTLTLSIRFANDGGENGARDASIAWIKLLAAHPNLNKPEPKKLSTDFTDYTDS